MLAIESQCGMCANVGLGQTAYLISIKASAALVLLVLVLPGVGFLLTKHAGLSTRAKDFQLARASGFMMFVGSLIFGLSGSSAVMILGLVLYVFGSGYNLLLRSLLASVVEPHHRGTLFNTIGMLESLGIVISGPLLAQAFRVGLGIGGVWIGLPFVIGSGLFLVAILILSTVG